MGTKISDVFDMALVSIQDYRLNKLYQKSPEAWENYLYGFLSLAVADFDDCLQPLDYDKAKVHVLKNNKFELRIYYFKGLNQISIDMQSEAMKKLNNKDNKNKVYRLK